MDNRMLRWSLGLLFSAALTLTASAQEVAVEQETIPAGLENRILMELEKGLVTIDLRPDLAPAHVERIKALVRQGFYDGLKFHRVVDDFMVQTGDPTGTGMGGSSLPDLPAEFSNGRFSRGTVGMARGQARNSANSQFFIMLDEARWLEGEHTIFGRVVNGIELLDRLRKGSQAENGLVKKPDGLIAIRLIADIERRKIRTAETAIVAQEAADLAETKTQEAAAASKRADEALQAAETALASLLAATEETESKTQIATGANADALQATVEKTTADENVVSSGSRLTKTEEELVNAIAGATNLSLTAQLRSLERERAISALKARDEAVTESETLLKAAQDSLLALQAIAEVSVTIRDEAGQVEVDARQVMASIDVKGGKAESRKALGELAITVAGVKKAQFKADLESDSVGIADEILAFSISSFEDATSNISLTKAKIEAASSGLDEAREAATEAEAAKVTAKDELTTAIAARQSAFDVLDAQKALELIEARAARKVEEEKAAADAAIAAETAAAVAAALAELAETNQVDPSAPDFEAETTAEAASENSNEIAPQEITLETLEPSDVVVALTKQLEAAIEAEGAARLELASLEVAAENALEAVRKASETLDAEKLNLRFAEATLISATEAMASAETVSKAAQEVLSVAEGKLAAAIELRDAAKAIGDVADLGRAKLDAEFASASNAADLATTNNEQANADAIAAEAAVSNAEESVRLAQETLGEAITAAAQQQSKAQKSIEATSSAVEVLSGAETNVEEVQELVSDLQSELLDVEKIAKAAALNLLEKQVALEEATTEKQNAITQQQLAEVSETGAQSNLKRARSALNIANDERDTTSAAALKRFSEATSASAASASDVPLFERQQ